MILKQAVKNANGTGITERLESFETPVRESKEDLDFGITPPKIIGSTAYKHNLGLISVNSSP
jgi:hypothetical protein